MSTPWLFCPRLVEGEVELDAAEIHHAVTVRRVSLPAGVVLFDGRGMFADAVVAASAPNQPRRSKRAAVEVRVVASTPRRQPTPGAALTLITAACKGPRLDWLIEKATELGVARIVLTEFERSVVRTTPAHAAKLMPTALSACKQARRAATPLIDAGVPLASAIGQVESARLLAAHLDAGAEPLAIALQQLAHDGPACLVVGPEGGLSDEEVDVLRAARAAFVSLGPFVLRVETAAIAAASAWATRLAPMV